MPPENSLEKYNRLRGCILLLFYGMMIEVDEREKVSAPLVFQCIQCHIVVGDSWSFSESNAEAKTITLSSASNIKRTADLHTSSSGYDSGSTYATFNCSSCNVSTLFMIALTF